MKLAAEQIHMLCQPGKTTVDCYTLTRRPNYPAVRLRPPMGLDERQHSGIQHTVPKCLEV